MTDQLWARLHEKVNVGLRRGAWYRVLKVQDLKAVVEVSGRPVAVASALLEIARRPPPRWTVVTVSGNSARKAPAALGDRYGVCPSCGHRAPLRVRVRRLRCDSCRYEFAVGWDEVYLP